MEVCYWLKHHGSQLQYGTCLKKIRACLHLKNIIKLSKSVDLCYSMVWGLLILRANYGNNIRYDLPIDLVVKGILFMVVSKF